MSFPKCLSISFSTTIDFGDVFPKVPLNLLQHNHRLWPIHQVDCQTMLSKSSRPADPVQIRLAVGFAIDIHWQVKVHYNGHLLDVNTPGEDISCDEDLLQPVSESVKNNKTLLNSEFP